MTTTERIKAKLEKRQADIKTLKEQLKAEEQAERKAQENAAKLEALCHEIAKAITDIVAKAEVTLPTGKQIITALGDAGLVTTIVEQKVAKAGQNGTRNISYEGEQISWAKLAEKKGYAVKGASAHKVVFQKDRALHGSIPHEHCPYK